MGVTVGLIVGLTEGETVGEGETLGVGVDEGEGPLRSNSCNCCLNKAICFPSKAICAFKDSMYADPEGKGETVGLGETEGIILFTAFLVFGPK